jgi:N-acetylglucosaminyl-diphospho-decaprenol L-rhamnosyltransferase
MIPHIRRCNAPERRFLARRKGRGAGRVHSDMPERPDLSVIVVTHRGGELALRVLRTALAAIGPIDVEWLVVDSGSSDGTPDAIERELPQVTVVRRPNIGFAAANNVALRSVRGRYVLLLNPDVEIVDGTLAQLVAVMDGCPDVGIGSSITHYPDGTLQESIRRFPSPARQLGEALMLTRLPGLSHLQEDESRPEVYEREQSADWLSGSFLLARREAVEQAGGLDERFFLFSEETDWCLRVRAAGWDIRHFPTLRLTHHTGRTERPDLYAQNSYSKVLYARKHFAPPARAAFRAALALRHALRCAGFALPALRRPEVRERLAAERLALLVVLGLTAPCYGPYAERNGTAGRP